MENSLKMGPLEWVLLILLSMLWGGSFFFNKVALMDLKPFTVVGGRVVIAGAVLLGIVYVSGLKMPRSLKAWGAFLVMGALNNLVPFSLIVWGQQQIASGLASVLNATTPMFTVFLAHFLTSDERATYGKLAGVALGLAGVSFMVGWDSIVGAGDRVLPQLAVLCAALCYASAGIFGRRLRRLPALVAASGQVSASAVMMLPLALWTDRPWTLSTVPGAASCGAVLGLAVLCTGLAYLIYFRLLAVAGATNLLLVTFLIPVSAILLGRLVLGEHMSWHQYVGMAAIGAALALIDGRLFEFMKQNRNLPAWRPAVRNGIK